MKNCVPSGYEMDYDDKNKSSVKHSTLDAMVANDPELSAAMAKHEQKKQTFAHNLAGVMLVRDITSKALIERTGLGEDVVKAMLNGQIKPQPKTFQKLCEVLEVSQESLWPED